MLDGEVGEQDSEALDPLAPIEPDVVRDKEKVYWALWQGQDLVDAMDEKTRAFFEGARAYGLIDRWVIGYAFHHGSTPEDMREMATQAIGFTGNELERVRFHINLVRSSTRMGAIMALGERANFKTRTLNSDHKSQAQAEITDRIVNGVYSRYYAKYDPQVAEGDGFAGACGTHTRWDFQGGDRVTIDVPVMSESAADDGAPLMGEDGMPVREQQMGEDGTPLTHPKKVMSGAPYVTLVFPWRRVTETRAAGTELWTIIRENESKWNVIGSFGEEFREAILRQKTSFDEYDFASLFRLEQLDFENKDLVTVEHFYHARCAAIPDGRYVVKCGDVILWDGPCPTKEGFPYAEMKSSTFVETLFPYADNWNLTPLSQALNQNMSDELNNLSLFSRQSTYSYKGSGVTTNGITRGTHWELPEGAKPPGALQFAAMPQSEPFKNRVLQFWDRITGENSTTRGEPDPNVTSGTMAALMDSNSIRFQSFRQQAARDYRVRNAQIAIDMISRYGESKFFVDVAGIEDRTFVQEFSKDDLNGIQRVDMDVVSPMMQTGSGRFEWMIELQKIPAPERAAAHEFVMTGDPDAYLGKDRSTDMYVRRENERLITGKSEVTAVITDDPVFHIPKHRAAMERILASDNPDMEAVQRIQMHILMHEYTWLMEAQPILCQHLGILPPPPIGPSPTSPEGNAAFRFQMQLQGGMPMPMAPLTPSGAAAPGGAPAPSAPTGNAEDVPAGAGNPPANGGTGPVHPNGTELPSPAQV